MRCISPPLDHVEISVPDAAKSAAFYARIFGGPIWKNNQDPEALCEVRSRLHRNRTKDGNRSEVDHFFGRVSKRSGSRAYTPGLSSRGIAYKDYPSGRDLNVSDPDGIHLQLSADNTWSQLGRRHSGLRNPHRMRPGEAISQPIFRPTGPRSHSVECFRPGEVRPRFYEKIFGAITQRNNKPYLVRGRKIQDRVVAGAGGSAARGESLLRRPPRLSTYKNAATKKSWGESNARLEKPESCGCAGVPAIRMGYWSKS